ncbi:MAG: hypothetical protein ABSB58_00180 [Gemmatimonadales bacterium]|jgi:hypothetical protein
MSEIRIGAVALAALCWAAGLPAQAPPGATPQERALIARVDSLWREDEARVGRKRQAYRDQSRGRLIEAGGLAVVVPGQVPAGTALGSLDTAAAILRDFGGVPERFVRSVVVVAQSATDTSLALAAAVARGRRRVPLGGVQLSAAKGGGMVLNIPGLLVASAVAAAYKDTRDSTWREWLPGDLGFGPWSRGSAWAAFGSLARSPWAVGSRCLAGEVRGCRLYLGVDRDSSPYRSRYGATEMQEYVNTNDRWLAQGSATGRECLSGAATACYEFALEGHRLIISPFPADADGRRSLVRAVRALHGARAVERALADSEGGVGERLARAAGIEEDSLLLEWRHWVLTRGGRPQDRNLLADAAPAALLACLLLAVARRSRG